MLGLASQSVEYQGTVRSIGIREEQGKVVRPDAECPVLDAPAAKEAADARQHSVPVSAATARVQAMKLVHIQNRERQRVTMSYGTSHLSLKLPLEASMVTHLSKCVGG
jgi:hypothetical protein